MAYISNITQSQPSEAWKKFGSTLSLGNLGGGSSYLQPTKLLTGTSNRNMYQTPSTPQQDRSKLTITGQNDAMQQEFGLPQVSDAWKNWGSQHQLQGNNIVPINNPVSLTSNGPVQQPTTTTSTLPYGQNSGDGNHDYNGLITGLQNLGTALQGYANNQTSTNKGLIEPPKQTALGGFTQGLQQASKPNDTQQKYLMRLERQATKGEEAAREARRISDMYGNEISRVGQLGAGAVAGAKSTGTDVVGRGNANIAAESSSNRINALSAAQSAALQGTQQQLTANEQGINAFNNALMGANTQQQLGISALSAGGQLAMPSPAQYGQTVFDPTTGQYTGGNLDPQTQATNLAQQVMSGAMTYDQALASLGYAGQAGTNFLNNAITGAGGNPLQLQARGAGQQANISTQTTAGTDIARQGLGSATEQYVNLNTNAQYANQQASAVSQILASTGLNNISSIDYNKALRNIQERFSDPDRIALQTALREAQIAYTNLLSTAGLTPSGSEAQALSTLNFDHSAEAINASIQQLENAVARRLQAQYGAVQQYNQNLGSGGTFGGGTTQGGGGLYDW